MDPNIVDGEAEWKYSVQLATPEGCPAPSQK
jgi:hypothetical protein